MIDDVEFQHASRNTDRLPPHSDDAEQGVLGCIILSPLDVIPQCVEQITNPEAFYDLRHRTIYEMLIAMWDAKLPIDIITLRERLNKTHNLEAAGGLAYLSSLPDAVPSASNVEFYIKIVREKFALRRIIGTCTEVVSRAYNHTGDVDELIDQAEADILKLGNDRIVQSTTLPAKQLVHSAIAEIDKYLTNDGQITGITTGLVDLDQLTWGFNPGDMIVIAARPGQGKTAISLNIADHVAVELKLPVGIFSMEMTGISLMMRMICARARVSMTLLRKGLINDSSWLKLTTACGTLQAAPLFIDDSPGLSILQLRARARRMQQQHGIKLIIIDYLQLMHAKVRYQDGRQQEVSEISKGVKGLAKELQLPIIALCQLNRKIEERGQGAKPKLSDLRESGSIEQDSDIVGMLYQGDDEDNNHEADVIPINLLIAKSRQGPPGNVALTFLKGCTRFESAAKINGDDLPATAELGFNQ